MSPHDLTDREKSRALLKELLLDFLAHQLDGQQRREGKSSSGIRGVLRFGQLLGVSMSDVYQELIVNCMEMEDYDRARMYCQYVCSIGV